MKLNNKDFANFKYVVANQEGFPLSEALRLWKSKYPEFIDFKKDVITHESLEIFGKFVEEMWDEIKPVTVEEALAIPNAEIRRTYFDCIGVRRLFAELKPTLRDRQVIKKKRAKWDDDNNEATYEFEDVYELYEIEGKKLFEKNRWGGEPNPIYAVRCWCTTTNREYWLYVDTEAATGHRFLFSGDKADYDAIRAIAWTIRIDVKHPQKIYRQGDIIVVKKSTKSEDCRPYHLDRKQYLKLMYSET